MIDVNFHESFFRMKELHKVVVAAAATGEYSVSAMNDLTSRHPCPFPPPWASSWGDDRYGLWAQFELRIEQQSVQQRMRWIEPGEFLMGAAKGEAESEKNEHPQHPVIISQGFWLADTACTQVLWQALMHDNPSHFGLNAGGGPENPVDRVSWYRVQVFLQALQKTLPACRATLPTEAEWEYACRAGSQTPFSFGENITTDQVNFNGDFPFEGAAKGQNLQRTVEVKALPANSWGLYQMHGNVWEWCADSWRDYTQDVVRDPGLLDAMATPLEGGIAALEQEAVRALRGGGCYDFARNARAAYRGHYLPNVWSDDSGFRFVLRADSPASKAF